MSQLQLRRQWNVSFISKVNSFLQLQLFGLFLCSTLIVTVDGWWLLAAQLSASPHLTSYLPDNFHCNVQPNLTKKQRELCSRHPAAMRLMADGLSEAINECQDQFAMERWNCSTTFDFGLGPMKVATAEAAFLYAISAGGASHALARACANGKIPECGCGQPDSYLEYRIHKKRSPTGTKDEFIWAGCSDDVKFSNAFTRKFIDATERHRMNARSLMNLHNNRVGRKVLASNMKTSCKCHGVSGSCVTKTCWRVVPKLDEFASILKKKYNLAKQVYVASDSDELVIQRNKQEYESTLPILSRSGRFLREQRTEDYELSSPASRTDLVYLDPSPDYCKTDPVTSSGGTMGRECHSINECESLCCGRGWSVQTEFRREPCRCKFVWCCDVKCDMCVQQVERMFCQ